MIEELQILESSEIFKNPDLWQSLDVDYYPPRVERVWTKLSETRRLFVHYIHQTNEPCLFHKHKWPAAFKIVSGTYEMGISRCEDEINSDEAYKLPVITKILLSAGSYYEMMDTHALHYVKPINGPVLSLMLTGPLYPEAEYRKEVNPKLNELTNERKIELLSFINLQK